MMKTLIYIPFYNILIFLYAFVKDMGIAVILLTVLVRVALLKQSIKAEKSRLALQKLNPEIEKIKKQYKDDKEKQTKAMLELYKKEGINPFSSCLPTLFQLPFLIGLFVVFREGLKNGFPLYEPVKKLVANLAITSTAFGFLDLTKAPNQGILLALPVLAASLQYIQSRMMFSQAGTSSSSSMKFTVLLLPAVTLWFTLSFPAALSLYWIATTLFAIAQQYIIDYELKKSGDKLAPNKGSKK